MKIGIMSDTHDNMPAIKKAVEFFNNQGAEIVLHAGDIVSPFTASEFGNLKMKMIGVFGNNDGDKPYLLERFQKIGALHQDPFEFELDNKKFVLMHQPKFIDELLESGKYDVVVYGHTHKPDIRKQKILVINPGECSGWLSNTCTIVMLDTRTMEPKLYTL